MSLEQLVFKNKVPNFLWAESEEVISMARDFTSSYIDKNQQNIEDAIFEDETYLAYDLVKEMNQRGFLNMWLPRAMGGRGYHPLTMYLFNEEISAHCLGATNILGAHYVALSILSSSMNLKLMKKLFQLIEQGRAQNEPCLFSIAITEPNAGTDVEDYNLLERAQLSCHAKKVAGGYRLSGRKMFISNSHLSSWYIVVAYEDKTSPQSSVVTLAVPKGAKGFEIGKIEKKMGQSCCPASELMFDQCFIPDEHVVINGHLLKECGDPSHLNEALHDDIISMSRSGVGAMSAGVSRQTLRLVKNFLDKTNPEEYHKEITQKALADLHADYIQSKILYLEAGKTLLFDGPLKKFTNKRVHLISRRTPKFIQVAIVWCLCLNSRKNQIKALRERFKAYDESLNSRSALGSLTKSENSKRAMRSVHNGLKIMGTEAITAEAGMEKVLRDSKLLEIYEGSSEINSLNFIYRTSNDLEISMRPYD